MSIIKKYAGNTMKSFKTVLFGALCVMLLSGCGAQENYDNTAATHTPDATHGTDMKNNNDNNSVRDDAGNIIDDAGNVVEDAGDAVGGAVKDVGDAVKD